MKTTLFQKFLSLMLAAIMLIVPAVSMTEELPLPAEPAEVVQFDPAPTAEPAPEPALEVIEEVAGQPAPEMVLEPIAEPVPEMPAEPTLEPTVVPEATAEPTAEPLPEVTAEPVIEQPAQQPYALFVCQPEALRLAVYSLTALCAEAAEMDAGDQQALLTAQAGESCLVDEKNGTALFDVTVHHPVEGCRYELTEGLYFLSASCDGYVPLVFAPFTVAYEGTEWMEILLSLVEEPETTAEPEVTAEPEITAEPEVTGEPEITVEPEVTVEPEATAEPEVTAEPEITVEPEATAEPEITAEPEVTIEPEITAEPENSVEPESTVEPEVTVEPEITAEPAPAVAVTFDKLPETLALSVYALAEDGSRIDYAADENGVYALTAGLYYYDAFCDGYSSVESASFTVGESETHTELVWLLANRRAAMNRSEAVLLFGVHSDGDQALISEDLQALLDELGVVSAEHFYTGSSAQGGYESVYYATMNNDDVWFAVDMLLRHPDITFAEPEFLYFTSESMEGLTNSWATGDQSYLTSQAYLKHQQLPSIWAKLEKQGTPPGKGTIVAVIDTGVDYTHPDLDDNMWINRAEANGTPGADDDGNGYVDDIYGYNFIWNSGDPMDDHGHGTHVAGVIAMEDNNQGGIGIAYASKIMAIKAGQATGSFSSTNIAKAIMYAAANGADVINMSFGGYAESNVVENALKAAYSECVLVAAAGNDGMPTSHPFLPSGVMYPAGYDYVLGVMATDHKGESVTGFSNYDTKGGAYYQLAAPGYGMYSTLPGDRYAAWSGTSMAAPVVSAAAAIIRSSKPDGSVYSSRYIIGQLVGASKKTAFADDFYYGKIPGPSLDLLSSLKYTPVPQLAVTGVHLFDSKEFSSANNGDGVWQNGETIELGLQVRNHWGAAINLSVTADALTDAGDPGYVTFEDSTTLIDSVGTYATANSGYVYDDGMLIGFTDPIRFTISADTANGVQIPINLHVTGYNGMDESDQTVYAADATYVLTVENGSVISGILTEDTTLTNDRMWIIRGSVQVPEGITLTVDPGTHIHFERAYTGDDTVDNYYRPYLQVLGAARFNGTESKPIRITTDSAVGIVGKRRDKVDNYQSFIAMYYSNIEFSDILDCTMQYVSIEGGDTPSYDSSSNNLESSLVFFSKANHVNIYNCRITGEEITNSRLERCVLSHLSSSRLQNHPLTIKESLIKECLFGNCLAYAANYDLTVTNSLYQACLGVDNRGILGSKISTLNYNAFLNRLNTPSSWSRPKAMNGSSYTMTNTYWGTDNPALISEIIVDSNDLVSYGTIAYEPYLTSTSPELETIYPFVLDAWVTNADGNRIENITPGETVTFHVLFNRDMNTSVQPNVAYGAASPYNDYRLYGDWKNAREWTATQTINPLINYGTMYFYIEGAVAASDSWLVTAPDTRLWFTIAYSGAEALVLQSSADANGITLTWTQDDFDTLAGYNLYRSQQLDNAGMLKYPTKINSTILPYEEMTYLDSNVVEGETYYYMFTVMQTDFTESDGSNVTSCTALDMTAPVIVHTPVDMVLVGETISIAANVTDNVKVDAVTLYARLQGAENWTATTMYNTTGDVWYAAINADTIGVIEYYVEASDGVGTAVTAQPDAPHAVQVVSQLSAPGDVNMDGSVDIMDLMLITRSIAGLTELGSRQQVSADVNADGNVDIFDLMKVAQYVCGIIPQL